MNKRGFMLIELVFVLIIIGILVNIAIPVTQGMKTRALAASATADVNAIRVAAFGYAADNQNFPRSARWGRVPNGLAPYLPSGFSFRTSDGRVRYRWVRRSRRRASRTGQLGYVGVRVTRRDRDLMRTLRSIYRGANIVGNATRMFVYIE